MAKHNDLGNLGENLAIEYLQKRNYEILDRNYHCRFGEIDIICRKDNVIIFAEVKTRKNNFFISPLEAVNQKKIEKIILTAQDYISLNYHKDLSYRFDVLDIIIKKGMDIKISHIKGAFEL